MAEQAGVEEVDDVPSQEELVVASKFFLYFCLDKLNALNINNNFFLC